MANQEQLDILRQGVEVWNKWRELNTEVSIDLANALLENINLENVNFESANLENANLVHANLKNANLFVAFLDGADLFQANFSKANLCGVILTNAYIFSTDLSDANLTMARLISANLSGAILNGSNLDNAVLHYADLSNAELMDANLSGADFTSANLRNANLKGAKLINATLLNANLVNTRIEGANISNSKIYGVNVWDMEGDFKEQKELIITPPDGTPIITVDNIKVAQFIYLILNNKEIRDVLNTLTSKTVLILGRFALPERKVILDALRDKLREYNLLPIVFDFERPTDKDFTETIKTLAGMCYFVIADVTNPKSSPLELQAAVPDYQIPFVPIIQEGEDPFAMMVDLQKKYDWVLDTISYKDGDQLIKILKKGIIDRAMKKHDELKLIKAKEPTIISAHDFE